MNRRTRRLSEHSAGGGIRSWLVAVAAAAAVVAAVGTPTAASADETPRAPWSAERDISNPEDLEVTFVTFSPGATVPTWFGHSAIVIEDRRLGVSRLYNYGMFSFDGTLLVKFAMGRLWFWVGQQPERATYEHYKSKGRAVRLHRLNLPPAKRKQIAEFLAWNVQPENREYLYHHYRNNCATKPRDILNEASDGALREETSEPSELTLREHTRRYTHHNFPMDLLLMYMMNDSIDQPIEEWDAMFLPGELEENALDLEYETASGERRPLIEDTVVYYEGESRSIPERAPPHWPWALLYGFVIGAAALGLGWWWLRDPEAALPRAALGVHQALVGLIAGLPGLALFVMSIGTDHSVTYWNENLFFANPLTFAVLPLGVALALGRRWTLEWLRAIWMALVATGALGLMLKVLPSFDQQNRQPVAFLLPITIGCAAALWLLYERLGPESESEPSEE